LALLLYSVGNDIDKRRKTKTKNWIAASHKDAPRKDDKGKNWIATSHKDAPRKDDPYSPHTDAAHNDSLPYKR
jgi:hypothetical protein